MDDAPSAISVVPTVTLEFASLSLLTLPASWVLDTPPLLILTAPFVTPKSAVAKLATPFSLVEAS